MEIDIPKSIEESIRRAVFADLEKGDPDRDVPHTTAVVHYAKEIIKTLPSNAELDPVVVVLAAYTHDWGYTPFFREGEPLEFREYMEAKKRHMDVGANMVRELLTNQEYSSLSQKQKERITHLVQVHDRLEKLADLDERVLLEADTLGGLDTGYMRPSFTNEANQKYMNNVREKRFPLFVTNYSKNIFESLYRKRIDYYAENFSG